MVLTMALMVSMSTPAFALSTEKLETATLPTVGATLQITADLPEAFVAKYLKGEAVVISEFENNSLLVKVNQMEVALNVSEETLVMDAKTGLMGNLKGLKAGDLIFVYYSPAMTRSLPPQSYATAIITNIEKDKAHPEFFTVKEVVSSSDKEVSVLNEEGDLIATILKNTPFSPFRTKQIVGLQDIKVGTQLFIWYDVVALSYPGQTQVQKAVLVGQSIDDADQNAKTNLGVKPVVVPDGSKFTEKISINGKMMDLGKLTWYGNYENNSKGIVMVPLRVIAEALGFKVTWDNNAKSALLDYNNVKSTVAIGQDGYFKASSKAIGLTQSFELGAKAVLIDSRTYVPATLFNLLYSDNDAVVISK